MDLIHQLKDKRCLNKNKVKIKKIKTHTSFARDSLHISGFTDWKYGEGFSLQMKAKRAGIIIPMSGTIVFVTKVDIKVRENYIMIKGQLWRKHNKCKYIFAQQRHI